jgi:hypothetical protein
MSFMRDRLKRGVNDALVAAVNVERRVDPYFRDAFDAVFRPPLQALAQRLIDAHRADDGPGLAQERELPGEEDATRGVIEAMSEFLRQTYPHPPVERAGNTKTYGVVRAEFTVPPDLPGELRRGIFATSATYRAWVRFAGPGPRTPPDIRDNGILSIGVKLMGVPGPKLSDDERSTQDFTGISAPTFTTPTVLENVKLQRASLAGWPVLYFLGPRDSHLADALMQGLYARTQRNPLAARYWSCSSYLLGEGQAMHYSLVPRSPERTPVPWNPPPDYLREAMAATLARREAEFEFRIQLQRDARRMPIEHDGALWPERLSPFVPAATLRIPAQSFDSPAQLAFARNLSYNPWHALPEHRPLGNQNRARKAIYLELSRLRQAMGGDAHVEPTGDEVFDD